MNWNCIKKFGGWSFLLLTLCFLGGGCSGIHATKSFSPLDFFMPGIGKASPQPPAPESPVRAVVSSDPEPAPLLAGSPAS